MQKRDQTQKSFKTKNYFNLVIPMPRGRYGSFYVTVGVLQRVEVVSCPQAMVTH